MRLLLRKMEEGEGFGVAGFDSEIMNRRRSQYAELLFHFMRNKTSEKYFLFITRH